ncbi:MAG: polysaccharide deacetylase family protein [Actinomycetota bacterium]
MRARIAAAALAVLMVGAVRPMAALASSHSVDITAPADGAAVTGTIPVSATTTGTVAQVAFDWAVTAAGPWTPIAVDDDGADGWTASWGTAPYTGPAVLRATATEAATDGDATDTVSLAVDNLPPSVTVEVAPTPFSPNGDGRKDKTTITVEADEAGDAVIRVLDSDGKGRRRWERTAEAGEPIEIGWSGKTKKKRKLADGDYQVQATVTDAAGFEETAAAPVTIDTKAPKVTWKKIAPEPISDQKKMRFKFSAIDPSGPLHAKVVITDRSGKVDRETKDVASGKRTIAWKPRYKKGGLLFPGQYGARLRVRDGAGNLRVSKVKPWRVIRPEKARVFTSLDGVGRRVALTFDDCHFAGAWNSILKTLKKQGVEATFFCPGNMMNVSPHLVRRTNRDGHTLASHAWDHALLTGHSSSFTSSRLKSDAATAWKIAGQTTAPYFRPPYGALDAAVMAGAGATAHPRVILWDVDPQDWRRPGASVIVSRVLQNATPGSIILLHTLDQTAAALPAILDGLAKKNLKPVDLPDMFRAAGMKSG